MYGTHVRESLAPPPRPIRHDWAACPPVSTLRARRSWVLDGSQGGWGDRSVGSLAAIPVMQPCLGTRHPLGLKVCSPHLYSCARWPGTRAARRVEAPAPGRERRRFPSMRHLLVLLAVGSMLAVVPIFAGSAQASHRYCGRMTVRAAVSRLHIEIDVVRGSVSCRRARLVTRYAWSPKHRSHQGNKFLGDPRGWSCVVARATQPAVAGSCIRKRDRSRVTAFNLDYGE